MNTGIFWPSGLDGLKRWDPALPPSVPIITRGASVDALPDEYREQIAAIERGETTGDVQKLLQALAQQQSSLNRAITSATSALPVRENLEAEAKLLVPLETPVRNKLPRTMGQGLSSLWRVITSTGGGYGTACNTLSQSAQNAIQGSAGTATNQYIVVDNAGGFVAGDAIVISSSAGTESHLISTATQATGVIYLTAVLTYNQFSATVVKAYSQPGSIGGQAVYGGTQAFFAETGAPADHTTKYTAKSATYKLMGVYGSVTGLAMAGGANFQNQLAMEKTNAIRSLMLNEENALINADATATNIPWGDGSTAYSYNGLINAISTTAGTPATQIQTSVGALTVAHAQKQLANIWTQGGREPYIIANGQECISFSDLSVASNSVVRVMYDPKTGTGVLGTHVGWIIHPISGQPVPILASRFCPAGTMLFCSEFLPDGTPAADVDVLPQVQLPQLAPDENVQGYTAQELAPTTSAPQVYPFLVSLFSVLRVKGATVFAKSTGLTAV